MSPQYYRPPSFASEGATQEGFSAGTHGAPRGEGREQRGWQVCVSSWPPCHVPCSVEGRGGSQESLTFFVDRT